MVRPAVSSNDGVGELSSVVKGKGPNASGPRFAGWAAPFPEFVFGYQVHINIIRDKEDGIILGTSSHGDIQHVREDQGVAARWFSGGNSICEFPGSGPVLVQFTQGLNFAARAASMLRVLQRPAPPATWNPIPQSGYSLGVSVT